MTRIAFSVCASIGMTLMRMTSMLGKSMHAMAAALLALNASVTTAGAVASVPATASAATSAASLHTAASPAPIDAAQAPRLLSNDTTRDAFTDAIEGLSEDQRTQFLRGRSLFRQNWVVAPAQDKAFAGLGPVYNRLSCIACHPKNGRGEPPAAGERLQSMLVRLSVPGKGPHGGPNPHPAYGEQFNEEGIPGVPGEGRIVFGWKTVPHRNADGSRLELVAPTIAFADLAYGPIDGVLTSPRVGPQVYGLGLIDAIPAEAIEAQARLRKPDGVRGRVNRVWDAAQQRLVVGRFGLKANAPNLRQQIAGAFVGDLGITSELFPDENCTAAQTACRQAPSGGHPELSHEQLEDITAYLSRVAAPERREVQTPQVQHGEALFAAVGCAVCHRPQWQTGAAAHDPALAGRSFAPYTDLLVHDMGAGLADGRPDYLANGREWRTPPLWGIGLIERVNGHTRYLHDGRARNLDEAVRWHDGEGRAARLRFERLAPADRAALLAFLGSL